MLFFGLHGWQAAKRSLSAGCLGGRQPQELNPSLACHLARLLKLFFACLPPAPHFFSHQITQKAYPEGLLGL